MPLYDIFSFQTLKKEKRQVIIIDYREKNSLVATELMKLGDLVRFEQLAIADYLVKTIAIERKTVSDFKASVVSRRIFDQIRQLKRYPSYLMLVEGILQEDLYSVSIHENAFRGMLLSLIMEHEIPIIFTYDAKDSAKYLHILANKKEKTTNVLRPLRALASKEEQVQFILEGFPHIGSVRARKLMEKFSSLASIILASEEELTPFLGKGAADFKNLVN